MRILRGALAGAIAGLVGAYAMERFQALWSETEKRARPRQTAGAAKDEPTTVKAAERVDKTVLHTDLSEEAALTAEMIHIWIVPGAPEPFVDLDDAWKRSYLATTATNP